jgi:orotidine-5'-phosphate decarboxylase
MTKLALACDFVTTEEFWTQVKSFKGLPVVIKVGLGLLPALGEEGVSKLRDQGFEVFVDAKCHDIPSQVALAVGRWSRAGADYLTIHLSGGRAMIEAALSESLNHTRVLGVSALTSLSDLELQKMKMPQAADWVSALVETGFEARLNSFVSSVREVPAIKKLGETKGLRVFCVTPGLRLDHDKVAALDQSRTATVTEAIGAGADLLVVGRSVFKSEFPIKVATSLLEQLS